MILFVSLINPGGVLWSKETLSKIRKRYCHEENVIVISDEVHSDLIFSKHHIYLFNLDDDMVGQSIVLHSPGK
ncbi:aminotransferase class I/II-fold pyridoxal phosphate-dependent enzyme, partial [Providencia rettgeri]|nr:aminotransferase class I/II-fold pyridoxal phosphate-dependent enzyme [Providencia rettgeri]